MRVSVVNPWKLPDLLPAPRPLLHTTDHAPLTFWAGVALTCTWIDLGCLTLPEVTQMAKSP
jgi:hypothetical protein